MEFKLLERHIFTNSQFIHHSNQHLAGLKKPAFIPFAEAEEGKKKALVLQVVLSRDNFHTAEAAAGP